MMNQIEVIAAAAQEQNPGLDIRTDEFGVWLHTGEPIRYMLYGLYRGENGARELIFCGTLNPATGNYAFPTDTIAA